MKKIDYERLIKSEKDMQKIIRMHQSRQIFLNNKQLDDVLKRRDLKNVKN